MSEDNQQLPDPLMMPSVNSGTSNSTNNDLNKNEPIQHIAGPNFSSSGSSVNGSTALPMPQNNQSAQLTGANPAKLSGAQLQQSTSRHQSLASNTPAIADDVDLIEKVWVEKAKEIVDKTQDNPYLQNKAISEIKADYIKKRYNKDITKSD